MWQLSRFDTGSSSISTESQPLSSQKGHLANESKGHLGHRHCLKCPRFKNRPSALHWRAINICWMFLVVFQMGSTDSKKTTHSGKNRNRRPRLGLSAASDRFRELGWEPKNECDLRTPGCSKRLRLKTCGCGSKSRLPPSEHPNPH